MQHADGPEANPASDPDGPSARSEEPGASATTGMKAGGYYDAHSEYQREVGHTGLGLLEATIAALGPRPGGCTIVDYGCGTGANSAEAFRVAVAGYRALDPDSPIVTVHADLPTNDWNTLFATVTGPGGYLGLGGPIMPTAVGTDFFGPCVAPGGAHFGMSFNSAHWLSSRPQIHAPGALYFDRLEGDAREALGRAAQEDWRRFLSARASDLAPGGRLLVQCIGSIPDPEARGGIRATSGRLLALMQDVAEGLVGDGLLERRVLEGYVLPVYARTVEEAVRPLSEGPLADAFEILVCETQPVPSPYEESYQADGDATSYAAAYAGFVRAFSESSLRVGLLEPGAIGITPGELVERYFGELERRLRTKPGRYPFEDWTLTVLLGRRGLSGEVAPE